MSRSPFDCPKCGEPVWEIEREVVREDGRKYPGPCVVVGPCGCEVLVVDLPAGPVGR